MCVPSIGGEKTSGAHEPVPKQKEHGPQDAQASPQIIQANLLLKIKKRKRNKDGQRNDFLDDLELAYAHDLMADPVGGYLEHVFEKRNAPAYNRRDEPGLVGKVFQMAVPGKRHEDVTATQKNHSRENCTHVEVLIFSNTVSQETQRENRIEPTLDSDGRSPFMHIFSALALRQSNQKAALVRQ
jgi:hypothetical protein